jgi:antitoxin MazE
VRLPKPLIEETGLSGEVEIRVRKGTIVIAPAIGVRRGWAEAAKRLKAGGEDRLIEAPTRTRFDEEEWRW